MSDSDDRTKQAVWQLWQMALSSGKYVHLTPPMVMDQLFRDTGKRWFGFKAYYENERGDLSHVFIRADLA